MKRLGIFLFHSPKGKVYRYVTRLLDEMSKVLDKLVIVCNGFVSIEGKERLISYADELVVRPNEGFDFAAWRVGIIDICGIDDVRTYDELVLFNDSFFGPFYPFTKVFDDMLVRKDVDFWGLSSHGAVLKADGSRRPPYLQAYFLVMRKNVIQSESFEEYWRGLEPCKNSSQYVERIACMFTNHFERLGYSWEAYTSTADLESDDHTLNLSHHMYNSYEMIVNRAFPIIKLETFRMARNMFLKYSFGDDLGRTYRYIRDNTDYDTSLIWEYLLDNYTLGLLSRSIGLTRVLSKEYGPAELCGAKRVALIMHLYYIDLFEEYLDYARRVPGFVDVYITTNDEEKRSVLLRMCSDMGVRCVEVRVVGNRGRDVAALLVGCRDITLEYDYVGFIHDKKSTQYRYFMVGQQFADLLTRSVLGTPEYIANIIELFEKDDSLGLVVPTKPWQYTHFVNLGKTFWTVCFDQTVAVLSRLCLKVPMSRAEDCIEVGTAFWSRSAALRPLFEEEWNSKDFLSEPLPTDGALSHGLERCFPYVSQSQGYYTLTVIPDEIAQRAAFDYRYMLDETVDAIQNNKDIVLKETSDYRSMQLSLNAFVVGNINPLKLLESLHMHRAKTQRSLYGLVQRNARLELAYKFLEKKVSKTGLIGRAAAEHSKFIRSRI